MASQLYADEFRNLEEVASAIRNIGFTPKSPKSPIFSGNTQANQFSSPYSLAKEDLSLDHFTAQSTLTGGHHTQKEEWPAEKVVPNLDIGSNQYDARNDLRTVPTELRGRYWFTPLKIAPSIKFWKSNLSVEIPIHRVQIANDTDSRRISTRYTDFITSRRRVIQNGCPAYDILGSATTEPEQLMNTASIPIGKSQTVRQWAYEIVQNMDSMCVAERLATALLITSLVRWQILPTVESYREIAECMKPTALQLTSSHSAWIDYIAW